ncbi:MarR family transcriptional regulator [Naumannella sp. ID2617S]|uniref:MarR family transcriptional regulator n=1 Tax=Enemella dayhoffiae TaxID=2016507 RepID=A0A255GZ99_9ACTN|nr:MarR family transcriptional regulator [Enemella dayhoffiae]NNG20335.1 MarR family transcriptional regulator [Naumannella sp. ID2617S]OYO20931.1 MarR family transcriptional regulator [Enemella dayhoffiae]
MTQVAAAPRWLDENQQQIWRAYLLGSARINERMDADLRPFGIDIGEYEILVGLEESKDRQLRMSDLAALVHQSRSRLTHTISRMEQAGLVTREACPEDRRGVLARLTDRGLALLAEAAPTHVESVRQAFIDLIEPDDLEALGRVFRAVVVATS